MTTTTTTTRVCHAQNTADFLRQEADAGRAFIAMPAPSSVSNPDYQVGYFQDGSALLWSRHDGYIVVPAVDRGYRTNLEHAARCMGHWNAAQRAAMVGPEDRWIDGVHWGADGRFIAV